MPGWRCWHAALPAALPPLLLPHQLPLCHRQLRVVLVLAADVAAAAAAAWRHQTVLLPGLTAAG
jgi:hypothetical protein